ncbi:MAG: GDSL-type esterase/lipase family protein [Leptospirales bacterium]|jgi:acyl-CoA thioesterase-1
MQKNESHLILFLGDSLTEGYRLAPGLAFPERIGERLVAAGVSTRVINAGVAGHTTADALRRLPLLLKPPPSQARSKTGDTITDLVIELGVNDLLQRIPLATVRANLAGIVQIARAACPRIRIFLFLVPPLGLRFDFSENPAGELRETEADEYTRDFGALFPEVAAKENLILLPFLLEGVMLRPGYNQPDLIHPNPRGQAIVVENVWRSLKYYF